MTLTLDRVIRHTVVFHLSTSTYIPNFIGTGKTFCGRTDGHLRPTLLGRLIKWKLYSIICTTYGYLNLFFYITLYTPQLQSQSSVVNSSRKSHSVHEIKFMFHFVSRNVILISLLYILLIPHLQVHLSYHLHFHLCYSSSFHFRIKNLFHKSFPP